MTEEPPNTVLAIGAHPDDIEFMMAGTLILLGEAGWSPHYMNLCDGRCGTSEGSVEEIIATRQAEARRAAGLIGARYHPPIAVDLQLAYDTPTIAKVVAVIRRVRPRVLLVQSPFDYMEDHVNAARIAVAAAFARGMPHYPSDPPAPPITDDVTVYHALPYGLLDPLRNPVRPHLYVDIAPALDRNRRMLACHESQARWLAASQGVSYLDALDRFARTVGEMSRRFEYAQGWQRRNHLGFSAADTDPVADALGDRVLKP